MDLFTLAAETILVTASGVLSPGPLFFALLAQGTRSGAKAGLGFAVAHTVVELPLVVLLALGFLAISSQSTVQIITGIAGGLTLIFFGGMTIRDILAGKADHPAFAGISHRNPLILGLLFTGLNPYFIIWWTTIGVKLVVDSILFASITGVLIMFAFHVWMDYAWLIGIAHLAKKGADIIGNRGYKILILAAGTTLIFFGLNFWMSALFRLSS